MPSLHARRCCLIALCLLAGGCGRRPVAPVIVDEPVYQNTQEGLRFLAPDGWKQHARGNIPGLTERERLLVEYRMTTRNKDHRFILTAIDTDAQKDLFECIKGRPNHKDPFKMTTKGEEVDVGGSKGLRVSFATTLGNGDKVTKDVTAVRRGTRVYFFTCIYPTAAAAARESARRAITEVIWKG